MRARFIGTDGNRGFQRGHEYDIRVTERASGYVVIFDPTVCPYVSWQEFYNNWQPVEMTGPVA